MLKSTIVMTTVLALSAAGSPSVASPSAADDDAVVGRLIAVSGRTADGPARRGEPIQFDSDLRFLILGEEGPIEVGPEGLEGAAIGDVIEAIVSADGDVLAYEVIEEGGTAEDAVATLPRPGSRSVTPPHNVTIFNMTPEGVAIPGNFAGLLDDAMDMVQRFWLHQSSGAIDFQTVNVINLPGALPSCDPFYNNFQVWADAMNLYSDLNGLTGSDRLSWEFIDGETRWIDREHIVVNVPAGCDFAGLGSLMSLDWTVGGLSFNSVGEGHWWHEVNEWQTPQQVREEIVVDWAQLIAHELGHNLSLIHANILFCTDGLDASLDRAMRPGCFIHEYADTMDVMGYSLMGTMGNLSSAALDFLGLETGYLDVTRTHQGQDLTLLSRSETSGQRSARIEDPWTGEVYWIERRDDGGDGWDRISQTRWMETHSLWANFVDHSVEWWTYPHGFRIVRQLSESAAPDQAVLGHFGTAILPHQSASPGFVSGSTSWLTYLSEPSAFEAASGAFTVRFDAQHFPSWLPPHERVEPHFTVEFAEPRPCQVPGLEHLGYLHPDCVPPRCEPLSTRSFGDVAPGSAFHCYIEWMSAEGIGGGWPDRTFRPRVVVTREQLATFLFRTAGGDDLLFTGPSEPTFRDKPATSPFFTSVEWLAGEGISGGWPDGTFRPRNVVTREQLAAFLYRMAGSPAFTAPTSATFSDVRVGTPFFHYIEWLAQTGITAGWPDGTFRPRNTVTREQTAAFLWRAVNSAQVIG